MDSLAQEKPSGEQQTPAPPKEPERKTLILREIGSDATEAKIKEIFTSIDGWECPKIVNMQWVINSWFVSFECEADCISAFKEVMNKGRYDGKKVRCRVKSVNANVKKSPTPRQSPQKSRQPKNAATYPTHAQSPYQPNAYYGLPHQPYYSAGLPYGPHGNGWSDYASPPQRGRGRSRRGGGRGRGGPNQGFPPYGQRGRGGGGRGGGRGSRGRPRGTPRHIRGSPRRGGHQARQEYSNNNVSSDYPGDFTRFTPEKMAEIIRAAYKKQRPPMPDTMKKPECKDIVRKDPLLDIPFPPEASGNTPSILPMTTPKKKGPKNKEEQVPALDLAGGDQNGKPANANKGGNKKKGGSNRGRPKGKRGGGGKRGRNKGPKKGKGEAAQAPEKAAQPAPAPVQE